MSDWSIKPEPRSDGLLLVARRDDEVRSGPFISIDEINAAKAAGRSVNDLILAAAATFQRELGA